MRPAPDRGSVTAELAVALPTIMLLMLTGLTGVNAVITKLRCVDAAGTAARAAARGEDGQAAGRRAAPDGATVSVDVDGSTVRTVVIVQVRPLGPYLPGFTVAGDAVAALEPGEESGYDGPPTGPLPADPDTVGGADLDGAPR